MVGRAAAGACSRGARSEHDVIASVPGHDTLVAMLLVSPSMLRKCLADHHPDASGHCRTCRAAGDSSGRVKECALWLAAKKARDMQVARRRGGMGG